MLFALDVRLTLPPRFCLPKLHTQPIDQDRQVSRRGRQSMSGYFELFDLDVALQFVNYR
jgi:hypothetical protein